MDVNLSPYGFESDIYNVSKLEKQPLDYVNPSGAPLNDQGRHFISQPISFAKELEISVKPPGEKDIPVIDFYNDYTHSWMDYNSKLICGLASNCNGKKCCSRSLRGVPWRSDLTSLEFYTPKSVTTKGDVLPMLGKFDAYRGTLVCPKAAMRVCKDSANIHDCIVQKCLEHGFDQVLDKYEICRNGPQFMTRLTNIRDVTPGMALPDCSTDCENGSMDGTVPMEESKSVFYIFAIISIVLCLCLLMFLLVKS